MLRPDCKPGPLDILLWLKINLLFAVMIAVWPTSGTNNRLVVKPSGTRDKINKSGTVPEIPGQLEPMYMLRPDCKPGPLERPDCKPGPLVSRPPAL